MEKIVVFSFLRFSLELVGVLWFLDILIEILIVLILSFFEDFLKEIFFFVLIVDLDFLKVSELYIRILIIFICVYLCGYCK